MTSDCKETWLCIFTEQIENRLEGKKSHDLLRAVGSLVAQTVQEHHLDVFVACVANPSMLRFAFPAKVNHGDAVPLTKVRTDVLSAAMEELGNFAALKNFRAEETTLILTGDFGLTLQECSAIVQKFNVTNSWRDWQMKATIHELPGDLIFVKNCLTWDLHVGLGSSWEYTNPRRARTELHDAVGAGVKMRLPFVVLNERTAHQKHAELRAELKARLRAEKAENAERLPKKLKTAAADGSQPVAQQCFLCLSSQNGPWCPSVTNLGKPAGIDGAGHYLDERAQPVLQRTNGSPHTFGGGVPRG